GVGGFVAEADHEVVLADRLLLMGRGGTGNQRDQQRSQRRGDRGGKQASSHASFLAYKAPARLREHAGRTSWCLWLSGDQGAGWGAAAQPSGQQAARPASDQGGNAATHRQGTAQRP